MKKRLFVGIPVPAEIQENVLALILQLKEIGADLNLVPPENLHFTLKFLGEVDDSKIKVITEKLAQLCMKRPTVQISVSKVGVFPSLDKINVIWIGGSPELLPLMTGTNQALNFLKPNDYSEDVPHLTIARVKSARNKEKLKKFLQQHQNDSFGEMIVDEIVLYQSNLTADGPVYKVIEKFDLK